jgi:eukaryotic-like serine/threonine-protein kinase
MPLIAGTKVDGYEVLGLLGAGGMGEVYRARDSVLKREVAIKVLPPVVSRDPDRLRRFEQEAESAAALNHPNILAVYQLGTFRDAPYLVSELLEGHTLRELLQRGPIPIRKAIDYGVQIARGLAAAHDKGIVHRDLKPDNLFVTKDGRVKILDFGLAKLTQRAPESGSGGPTLTHQGTEPGVIVGTVGYMSPEQVRGQAADSRADVFAFGAILYEMVVGKRAFTKPTSAETMSAILNEEPPAVSQTSQNCPPGLQRVVHRCLEKTPEQRFQSASDLAFALEALSESGVSGTTSSPAPIQRKTRKPLLWSAGLVATLALAACAYFVVVRRERAPRLGISEYTQLTHSGHAAGVSGTDGSRIYLDRGIWYPIEQVAVSGGEIEPVLSVTLAKPMLNDVSPDGSTFLVQSYAAGVSPTPPLYTVKILGGTHRYLADVAGAIWSPDGKFILYVAADGDFHIMRSDGTDAHKLADVGGRPDSFNWSPDGKIIRFTRGNALWEIFANGSNLHQLLAGWHTSDRKVSGGWSPDGEFFFFRAGSGAQIWALEDRRGYFRPPSEQPFQLTSGPLDWGNLALSKDGKKIFAAGYTDRGELARLDSNTNQFEPFLGGISADLVSFSKDGQSVAYVSYPEDILWKANKDGSERVQLSDPPLRPTWLRWSPDGSEIVFMAASPQGKSEAWIVSSKAGSPRRLLPEDNGQQTDPSWSPDGSKIIFATNRQGSKDENCSISILDLATHQRSTLPGSGGMFSPHWSPNGQYIFASSLNLSKLFLFDVKTQRWSTLYKGLFAYGAWSSDSRFIYFLRYASDPAAVLRIPVTGGETKLVVGLKGFRYTGTWGLWLGLDPTDAPLMLRDVGTSDIYALTLERK